MTRKPTTTQNKARQKSPAAKAAKAQPEKTRPEKNAADKNSGHVSSPAAGQKSKRGAAAPSASPASSPQHPIPSTRKPGPLVGSLIVIILLGALGAGVIASREIWWPYAEIYIPQLEAKKDPRIAVLMERLLILEDKIQGSNSSAPINTESFQAMEQMRKKLSADLVTVLERLETVERSMKTVELMATAIKNEEGRDDASNGARDSLVALVNRVNTLEQSNNLGEVSTRLENLEEQTRIVDTTLSSKAQLLEDVKRRMDSLESRQTSNADALSPAASALILAVGQLRDVVRQGQAFTRAMESVVALVPEYLDGSKDVPELIAVLQDHAKTGVVTHATLSRSLTDISVAVLQADRQIEGDGWISAAINRLGNLVMVRRVDHSAAADSTDARLARAEADLAIGDLAAAIDVLDGLSGPANGAIAPWLEQAKATLAVEQALTALNTIAIAQISIVQG